MRLILVRHGETSWNQERRVQGQSDVGLSESGRQQVRELALALKKEKIDAIYSSPLRRALETAQAIVHFHSLEVGEEENLKELDVGELDGLTYGEMNARFPGLLEKWRREAASTRMPGGESLRVLQRRAWASIESILGRHGDGTVVVVSHNFAILSIICRAVGLPLSRFRRFRQDTAAMSILDFGERGTSLVLFNDRCHLNRPL